MSEPEKDWKLKLRYGKITTPYKHVKIIAEGIVDELRDGFECRPGNAFMGMKAWASSFDEAGDMIQAIGKQIGFEVTGNIEIFDTEPIEPPGENPHGYDIKFTPFDS